MAVTDGRAHRYSLCVGGDTISERFHGGRGNAPSTDLWAKIALASGYAATISSAKRTQRASRPH
jgi:hypothetical protein